MLVATATMARKEASHDTSAGLAIGLCLWWDRFGTGTDRNRQDRPRAGSAADDHVAQLTAIDCYRWIRPGPSSSTHVAGAARRGGRPVALRPLVALTVLATSHLMVTTPSDGHNPRRRRKSLCIKRSLRSSSERRLPWPRLSAFESDTRRDSSDGHPLDPLRLTIVAKRLEENLSV